MQVLGLNIPINCFLTFQEQTVSKQSRFLPHYDTYLDKGDEAHIITHAFIKVPHKNHHMQTSEKVIKALFIVRLSDSH